ncbi:hypothetical protein KA005_27215, partial [bacterium]|nr:hypothetical protein [bacterium]
TIHSSLAPYIYFSPIEPKLNWGEISIQQSEIIINARRHLLFDHLQPTTDNDQSSDFRSIRVIDYFP